MARALATAGAEVVTAAGLSKLAPGLVAQRYVFFGWNGEPQPLHDLAPRLKPGAEVCAVVPASSLGAFVELMRVKCLSHCLVKSEDMSSLTITALKLFTGDIFGIEKYLPADVEVHLTRLRDYNGRSRAIDSVLAFAEAAGVRRQIRSAIGQVCEELLMNALYDAPVDEDGKGVFAEVDPHARVDQQSPRPVSIRYATTPQHFAVAVRDRYGTLQKQDILNYLEKCLKSPNQIDRKTYGAGLGLYLIANNAAQFIVNLAPGMASEVVCTFDRRGAKVPLRILSVFVHPGLAALQTGGDEAAGASGPVSAPGGAAAGPTAAAGASVGSPGRVT